MVKLGRIIVKKKCKSYYGELELENRHRFIQEIKGIKMSPLLQEIAAYTGQSECYESSSELIEKLLRIQISDSTIHKICQKLGDQSKKWLVEERTKPVELAELKEEEVVYAHCDGGMVFTRTDQWKEVKVGRVYRSGDLLKAQQNRGLIKESWYMFHIGEHETFENKMSEYVDKYEGLEKRLIFIVDGAKWIYNWITAEYPKAQQILDFYHALEHFGTFSKKTIPKEKEKKEKNERMDGASENRLTNQWSRRNRKTD